MIEVIWYNGEIGERMKEDKKKIGEILVEAGIVNTMQLSAALGEQKQWGGRLGSIITKLGFADEKDIAGVLEKQLGLRCISLEDRTIPPEVLKRVKIDVAKKYCIIPIELGKGTITVAISDPTDLRTIDELSFTLGTRIKPVLALESGIRRAIAFHYEGIVSEGKTYKSILGTAPEKSMVMKDERDHTPYSSSYNVSPPGVYPEKKEITLKTTFEALLALLLEKGLITKEELMKKIKEKSG